MFEVIVSALKAAKWSVFNIVLANLFIRTTEVEELLMFSSPSVSNNSNSTMPTFWEQPFVLGPGYICWLFPRSDFPGDQKWNLVVAEVDNDWLPETKRINDNTLVW